MARRQPAAARPRGRSGTTWTALAGSGLLAVACLAYGGRALLRWLGVLEVDREAALAQRLSDVGFGLDERSLQVAAAFDAAVTLPFGVLFLVLTAGLAAWRPWAKEASLGVYGLGGTAFTLVALSGLGRGGPHAAAGLVVGLAVVGIAGCLVLPPTARDFDLRRLAAERADRLQATERRRQAQDASG